MWSRFEIPRIFHGMSICAPSFVVRVKAAKTAPPSKRQEDPMKYMLIIAGEEGGMEDVSPEESERRLAAWASENL